MADRYGRQRDSFKESDKEKVFYYTLASSTRLIDFLYVVKDKCEASFPKITVKNKRGEEYDAINKEAADSVDYGAWQALMAYTLWINIIVKESD